MHVFCILELSGALGWFTWAGLRIGRFQRLISLAEPAPLELSQEVEQLAASLGLLQCPQVLVWDTIASPMTWHWGRRSNILLPRDLLKQLNHEQLTSILLHELAHLRRGDHWSRILEIAAIGFYWWHPVVWWARRELERVEEQACDAWVLWASPKAGPQYAGALLQTIDFLSQSQTPLSPLASGIGRTAFLQRRLSMIVEGNVPRLVSGGGRLMIAMLAIAMLPFAPAWAANAPSLKEIKSALDQRRALFQSLYLETTGETTSPYSKEQLHNLPGDYRWNEYFAGQKVIYHYGVKGEKRFSLFNEKDKKPCKGYNGTWVWTKQFTGDAPDVTLQTERTDDGTYMTGRFFYPNSWLGFIPGAAIAGPNLSAKYSWDNDLFYYFDSVDHQEQWNLTASDQIEEIDGVKCAVIEGKVETAFKDNKGKDQKRLRHVKAWFDLEHGMALRKWEDQSEGGELIRVVNSHFEEVQPGLWIPKEMEIQFLGSQTDPKLPEAYRGKLLLSTKIQVAKCTINELKDEFFDPKTHIQPGDRIHRVRKSDRIIEDIKASDL